MQLVPDLILGTARNRFTKRKLLWTKCLANKRYYTQRSLTQFRWYCFIDLPFEPDLKLTYYIDNILVMGKDTKKHDARKLATMHC